MGNLYDEIHLFRNPSNILYYGIFCYRRLVFVLIPLIFKDYPFLQIQILLFFSSIYMMQYLAKKPHITIGRRILEMFNESMIMLVNYHFALFTGFTFNEDFKYSLGFSYVVIFCITVAVNISVMFYKQYEKRRTLARWNNIIKAKKEVLMEAEAAKIADRMLAHMLPAVKKKINKN